MGSADGAGDPATIEDLQLPVRAYNSLRRVGIHTVDDLSARTEADLLGIENLGPQSVREIKERLAGLGRHLAEQAADAPASDGSAATAAGAAADGAAANGAGAGGRAPDEPGPAPRAARPPDEDAIDLFSVAGLPGAEAGTAGARRGGRPAAGDLRPAARPPQRLTAARIRRRRVALVGLSIPGPAVRRLQ